MHNIIINRFNLNFLLLIFFLSDPLDCLSDPCHLTWLLRGKNVPQVLNSMYAQGSCSNGSAPYSDIASFDFDNICTCACNQFESRLRDGRYKHVFFSSICQKKTAALYLLFFFWWGQFTTFEMIFLLFFVVFSPQKYVKCHISALLW